MKFTGSVAMRLKESSKERSLFLAYDKKWAPTDSIIRSTLVRPQSEKQSSEREGFIQGSADVLGGNEL
jgi:hypothetical protein